MTELATQTTECQVLYNDPTFGQPPTDVVVENGVPGELHFGLGHLSQSPDADINRPSPPRETADLITGSAPSEEVDTGEEQIFADLVDVVPFDQQDQTAAFTTVAQGDAADDIQQALREAGIIMPLNEEGSNERPGYAVAQVPAPANKTDPVEVWNEAEVTFEKDVFQLRKPEGSLKV